MMVVLRSMHNETLTRPPFGPDPRPLSRASSSNAAPIPALVDARLRTTVTVDAAGYDDRTSGNGCNPDGCIPENTRDNDIEANSRWSCQGDDLDSADGDEGCWIDYYFDDPQDIVRMRIAFHKGCENVRTLDVYVNDSYHSTITSNGYTVEYQNFLLNTDETDKIRLRLENYDSNSDVWLSLTEVRPESSPILYAAFLISVTVQHRAVVSRKGSS